MRPETQQKLAKVEQLKAEGMSTKAACEKVDWPLTAYYASKANASRAGVQLPKVIVHDAQGGVEHEEPRRRQPKVLMFYGTPRDLAELTRNL